MAYVVFLDIPGPSAQGTVLLTMGWTLLHKLPASQTSTNMFTALLRRTITLLRLCLGDPRLGQVAIKADEDEDLDIFGRF